jgi:hypothetical protein
VGDLTRLDQAAGSQAESNEANTTSHFWVSTFPYFESTLVITPPISATAATSSKLLFYDADGQLVNESIIETGAQSVTQLELDQFLGGCKLESGLKHAHLVVQSPLGSGHHCRIHGREYAALLGEPFPISAAKAGFFPLTFSADRSSLLAIINFGAAEANLRCRLFLGKRCPEVVWSIPALGSRVINLEVEFREYTESKETARTQVQTGTREAQGAQAYLRVTTKSSGLGVQLIERSEFSVEQGIFSSLA